MIALLFSTILVGQLSHATQELYPCFKYGFEEDIIFDKGTPSGVGAKKEGDDSIPGMSYRYLANSGPKPLVVHVHDSYYKMVNNKIFVGRLLNLPDSSVWRDEGIVEWTEKADSFHSYLGFINFYHNPKAFDVNLIGANDRSPKTPDDFSFSIPVYFDGKSTELKGKVKYRPLQRACANQPPQKK